MVEEHGMNPANASFRKKINELEWVTPKIKPWPIVYDQSSSKASHGTCMSVYKAHNFPRRTLLGVQSNDRCICLHWHGTANNRRSINIIQVPRQWHQIISEHSKTHKFCAHKHCHIMLSRAGSTPTKTASRSPCMHCYGAYLLTSVLIYLSRVTAFNRQTNVKRYGSAQEAPACIGSFSN